MKKIGLAFSLALLIGTLSVQAQTTVKFNVNIKPFLLDSTVVPPLDYVELTGDLYPLGQYKFVRMTDEEPIDSVYSVEVTFPRRFLNRRLLYNFVIRRPSSTDKFEGLQRNLVLRPGEFATDSLFFDSFAW